jgi:hypothetical protein
MKHPRTAGGERVHEDDRSEQASAAAPGRGDALTGDTSVDAALSRLAELETLPVREHVAVFDAVHAALQDRLADVGD